MARRELGPAALAVAQAVERMVRGVDRFVVGCSGGPDSLALALASKWASRRCESGVRVVIVDHQLQQGSDEVAERIDAVLAAGVPADRLTLVPDCGFSQTARWATTAKLRALVAGRDLVLDRTT